MPTIGSTVPLEIQVYDTSTPPVLVDPVSIVLTVQQPDGTILTPSIVHVSTGTYSASVVPTQVGRHSPRWLSTGPNVSSPPDMFEVDPAYSTALVSLTDVYTHLQVPTVNQTPALTTQIEGFIAAAAAFVQYQTGPIVPQTFTEVHSGGGPTIVLDNPPVLTVATVTEYIGPTGYSLTQCELGQATGAYSFSVDDMQAGIICRRYTGGLAGGFAGGYRNVQVVYTAGVVAVPSDVRMAVLEDIRGLFSQTQYGGPSAAFGGELAGQGDNWTQGDPINPIGTFPRLAALLEGPTRVPGLA